MLTKIYAYPIRYPPSSGERIGLFEMTTDLSPGEGMSGIQSSQVSWLRSKLNDKGWVRILSGGDDDGVDYFWLPDGTGPMIAWACPEERYPEMIDSIYALSRGHYIDLIRGREARNELRKLARKLKKYGYWDDEAIPPQEA
jgi:hypothetical protein